MRLEVQNGVFHYPGQARKVLENISFSAQAGDVVAILGPNGAGKTTLLRCMMGLLRWESGETRLDGVNLNKIPVKTLWKRISYVPQARQALMAYTVEEMVLLGRTSSVGLFSLPGREDRAKVDEVLQMLNLTDIRARSCAELSGGEFQMVLIARALASEPEVLVLDEPESNLDFKNQLLVLDTISSLAERGIACIFNTHYPSHALRRANKALMLFKNGESRFGDVRQVITEESLAECFGVQSVIGEVETAGNLYQDVIPVAIGSQMPNAARPMDHVLAGITIILPEAERAPQVNALLHDYSPYLIGRMGLPYRKAGLSIIHVTLDAPRHKVAALSDALGRIPDVSIKSTIATLGGPHDESNAD